MIHTDLLIPLKDRGTALAIARIVAKYANVRGMFLCDASALPEGSATAIERDELPVDA